MSTKISDKLTALADDIIIAQDRRIKYIMPVDPDVTLNDPDGNVLDEGTTRRITTVLYLINTDEYAFYEGGDLVYVCTEDDDELDVVANLTLSS